jgi:hypothetical protein
MQRRVFSIIGIISVLIFCSCKKDSETHLSSGNIITRVVTMDKFTGLLVDSKCKVILRNGSNQTVTVKISDNIVDDVDYRVVNGVWSIDFKDDGIATINNHEFTVIVESPYINSITMESSGELVCEDKLTNSPLSLNHNSSGKATVVCQTDILKIKMDGSGVLTVNGVADNVSIVHDSSGSLKAFNLKSRLCSVAADGSGVSELWITEKLSCVLNGSGDIKYKGAPTVTKSGDGSGNLIKVN